MAHTNQSIALVLSQAPGYSETFFKNKIYGLESNGFEVILFLDYIGPTEFSCKIVQTTSFNGNLFNDTIYSVKSLFNCLFVYPKQSLMHYRLDRKSGFSFFASLRRLVLNQRFFAYRVDWLHFGFGMLAVGRENIAETIGAKMAVSFRGFDHYLSPIKHPGCYDLLFKKHLKYHVLSNSMKQDLEDRGIMPNSIMVITPAIDTDFFSLHVRDKPTSVLQLVTLARLHWIKGLDYTLRALAILNSLNVPFHYTIIGDGDQKERLLFTAHQLGIFDRVSFVGKLPQEEVKSYLEQSDIYIQYSIQEGFCNAVLEAQAMGCLCVVSDAEGLSENVLDGVTGWVVPKREPKALAKKILEVSQLSDSKKQQIREVAIDRIKREFSVEQQIGHFIDFYKNF